MILTQPLRERPFDFQGGGGGFFGQAGIFFLHVFRDRNFFQHHRGLEIFFLPMYHARSNFFYCTVRMNNYMYYMIKSVICLEKTTIHNLQIYNFFHNLFFI